MNGIEKITGKIIGDARSEAEELLVKAGKESAEIVSGYEANAALSSNAVVENARAAAEEERLRAKGAADLERRKIVLSAKQELIDKAFSLALEKLLALPAEQYVAVISKIALNGVWTGSEEIVMSEEDGRKYGRQMVDAINRLLKEKGKRAEITLSKSTREITGGLVLKNGNIETNCTFEAILGQMKPELVNGVAGTLFA